jgi:hypothetical protein
MLSTAVLMEDIENLLLDTPLQFSRPDKDLVNPDFYQNTCHLKTHKHFNYSR